MACLGVTSKRGWVGEGFWVREEGTGAAVAAAMSQGVGVPGQLWRNPLMYKKRDVSASK